MSAKLRNHGLRKVCACPRRTWAKCAHAWHFNYKPKGGPSYRFSLDAELGYHVEGRTKADTEARNLRVAIDAGTFRRRHEAPAVKTTPATPDAVTLRAFGETFLARRGKPAGDGASQLRRLAAFVPAGAGPLGDKPLGAITEDDIEAFFDALRTEGRAASTRNHYVQLVREMFRWAVRKKYLAQNPIVDSEAIRREKMAKRNRRLTPDTTDPKTSKLVQAGEERRLLAAASPRLQRLILAALETGCRRGELLALRWRDVDLSRRELTVRAETAKTETARVLPMSPRLRGMLDLALTQTEHMVASVERNIEARPGRVAECFVFGDDAGLPIKNIKKSWETTVLKAHGVTPAWSGANRLTVEARAALRRIDLRFHDLRHEAGSRLIEAGWPIHHVSEMLGHSSLEQTSTYLNVTRAGLHDSMRRYDDRVARCNPVANEGRIEHRPSRNEDRDDAGKPLVQ